MIHGHKRAALAALILALAGPGGLFAQGVPTTQALTRRLALVVGSNAGAPGEVRLKYAVSDARRFASVLSDLGGVAKGDLIVLVDPSLQAMQEGFQRVRRTVAEAGSGGFRSEFILYYSGHSDDQGLHLGAENFAYESLRREIGGLGADVQVAIVDSCSSGSFTRSKGGASKPAFLFDASSDMEGHAYLTSSSEDEAAQESDKLGGSFFTHYFVSGLRGAADLDGKGVVTLNEAYAFAFKETLASTEGTRYGPQHASYDINLTGRGDLVFTDLRSTAAGLSLAPSLAGRVFIRDERGNLAVEVDKAEGKRMDLGLGPGRYDLALEKGPDRFRSTVLVSSGSRTSISPADFQWYGAVATTARGTLVEPVAAPAPEARPAPAPASISLGVLPNLTAGIFSSGTDRNISINLVAGSSASVSGVEVAALWNSDSRDVSGFQVAGLGNIVAGDVRAFQVSGVANWAGRDVRFSQLAGVANVAGGGVSGAQVAGLGNIAGLWDGRTEFVDGRRSLRGVQVAGGANFSANGVQGLQLAGGGNWSRSRVSGVQVAGGFNHALMVSGVQVGTVNSVGTIAGAQLGVVNIAGTVKGSQIGLVNISERMYGIPLGLISIEKDGVKAFETMVGGAWDSLGLVFKLGTRHTYNLVEAGCSFGSDPALWTFGLGLGARLGAKPLFLDFDLAARVGISSATAWTDFYSLAPSLEGRVLLGLSLGKSAVVAGGFVDLALPRDSSGYLDALQTGAGVKTGIIVGIQL